MQYRKGYSMLGYGCMRFATKNGSIIYEQARDQVMRAYELGVNYFDTAYIYPGSEEVLGRIVEENAIRDKIMITTKLPQYLVRNRAGLDKYLDEELKRLRTDYLDNYLLHHMTDIAQWEKLKALGIEEWITQQKQKGRIRNIGFSFHGNTDMFLKILNAYDWDLCLIQYNYMDEHSQAGRKGVEAVAAKGIPLFIMEPLRGGKLVDLLPEKAKKEIAADPHGWTPAEWAFRWLWNQPEITCVLSGMNSLAMVEENCRIASQAQEGGYGEAEFAMIDKIKAIINENTKVPCTGCRYCMPCPKGVDIPAIFSCYNHMYSENKGSGRGEFFQTVALRREPAMPSQCVECGKCEAHCPQSIEIRKELKEADKALNPWYYRIGLPIARRFMVGKKSK